MASRKPISKAVETNILVNSKRRCALCVGLRGDLGEKKGQIAHLDQDRSNNLEENLAFLCFEHHNEYDSRTSQGKGLTIDEVKFYRDKLYAEIEMRLNSPFPEVLERNDEYISHDRKIFERANTILPEKDLRFFLETLQINNAYTRSRLEQLSDFCQYFAETGNQFLVNELNAAAGLLTQSIEDLGTFLAFNFFLFPIATLQQENSNPRYALHPRLNPNLEGDGDVNKIQRYMACRKQLHTLCDQVEIAYKEYRVSIKKVLIH